MRFIALIPARYGSTRFPGKPLAGKPMIQRAHCPNPAYMLSEKPTVNPLHPFQGSPISQSLVKWRRIDLYPIYFQESVYAQ